ncbi:MAG: ABC transporter permease [Ruminococcaceae bacterium]|nr:ABC transporter permease [Oscillospiraceae bacterium]
MSTVRILFKRNVKLFFKDKGMFFTALITPMILLVLYSTFLGNVYRDSFKASLPEGMEISEQIIEGGVGGQLVSSILAVSCVTVAFCSNMLMVQDKATGARKDLTVSPVKPSRLALSYYLATLASTLIICCAAAVVCLIYLGVVGWYLSAFDVLMIFWDILLMVLFGTALSSVIGFFLSSQGQIAAVGSIVSSCYGFVCGAYMPISQFSQGLQRALSFFPGIYGTSLLRNHAMGGAFAAMEEEGVPDELIDGLRDVMDCNLYFFDKPVSMGTMYAILITTVAVLIGAYIVLNKTKRTNG